jgi:transposase-like protein
MTSTALARRFKVSPDTVRKRLLEAGAQMRPSGSVFVQRLTETRPRAMYLGEGYSVKQLAGFYGCSIDTVYRILRLHRIRKRKA